MNTETLLTTDSVTQKKMTERSLEDVFKYEKEALEVLAKRFEGKEDHPNYKELRALLIDQINDELRDYATDYSSDRRTNDLGEGSDYPRTEKVNRADY